MFTDALQGAIKRALIGAAVIDTRGNVLDRAGMPADDERFSLTDLVTHLDSDRALSTQLRAGELIAFSLGYDELVVAIVRAGQELHVVAVLTDSKPATLTLVWALRDRILTLTKDPGAPAAGPAELQVVELRVSVSREPGKN